MKLVPKIADSAEEIRVIKQIMDELKLTAMEKYSTGGSTVKFDELAEMSLKDYLFRPINAEFI